MKKTHVLHIAQHIEIGGLESLVVEICTHLDRSIFNVSILCLAGYDERYAARLRSAGIEIQLIEKRGNFDVAFFRDVGRYVKEVRADVLHAHSGCFLEAAIISRISRVDKVVFTAHGMPLSNDVQAILEDRLAAFAFHEIVAVSDEIAAEMKTRLPWVRDRIRVILNGVDTDRYRSTIPRERSSTLLGDYDLSEDTFLIGSVGRLESVKNYPMLLRALAALPEDSQSKAHLFLVGEGDSRAELRALANELGIANRVTFLGMQYHVHEILPLFDAFALSSVTEGTSISLLEAQACGLPAVVTDVGGNSRIVQDGRTGFLCDLNDDDAMSLALHRLQSDPRLAKQMGNAARSRVQEEFDLRSTVGEYEQIYRRSSP